MLRFARIGAAILLALALVSPSYAQQVPAHNIPVGKGPGVVGFGFAAPGTSGQLLTSNGVSADPSFQAPPTSATSASYSTVAALVAANVPAAIQTVTTAGYYSAGDGGGATYVRVVSLPSLPCYQQSADGAYWVIQATKFNVKWCGAKGDGSTNDTTAIANAMTVITTLHGVLYFPAVASCYVGSISAQDKFGFGIEGDNPGPALAGCNGGSTLDAPVNNTAINIFSNVSSGGTNNFFIRNLRAIGSGTGSGIIVTNGLHFDISNVESVGVYGVDLEGSGYFHLNNVYGAGGTAGGIGVGNGSGTLTNSGPGVITAGEFSDSSGGPAMNFMGDVLGLVVNGTMYEGENIGCSLKINGGGSANGSIDFIDLHGESNYGTAAASGEDICVGVTTKAGHVGFYGGNSWGQGSGGNYHAFWLEIANAADVVVDGFTVSKLGNSTGYNQAIFVASSFTGTYSFRDINKTDVASYYFDARTGGALTNWQGNATNVGRYDGYYATANLPTCNSSSKGWASYVTDATSAAFNAAPAGGGATPMPVICNGSAWAIH